MRDILIFLRKWQVRKLSFFFYLHSDCRLLGPTCTPKNQREERKENQKACNEGGKITAARDSVRVPIVVEKAFLFNGIEPIDLFPWLPTSLACRAIGGVVLSGTRETSRSGLAGMGAQRGVGVGVGRGAHWAEDRTGMEGVGGLFAIVGIAGRTLDVVDGAARGSSRRWLAEAAHLRVSLRQHRHCCRFLMTEWKIKNISEREREREIFPEFVCGRRKEEEEATGGRRVSVFFFLVMRRVSVFDNW